MVHFQLSRVLSVVTLAGLAYLALPKYSQAYNFDAQVQAWEANYQAAPIDIEGRVIDEHGLPIEGAQLSLIGFGDSLDNDGEATVTWENGTFELLGLARANVLVSVEAPGYYAEIVPVELQQPIDEEVLDLGDILLYEQRFDRARLTFTGDVMFGRRMLDSDDDGVQGEQNDLLHLNTLTQDTAALFRFVQPVLEADDLTSINLETPVTDNLQTPHPIKSFVFNAYPESAAALEDVGVDMVTLGNNHLYDYLEVGTLDTLDNLDALGMPWVGAGLTDTDARANWWNPTIGDIDLAMQGFGDLRGTSYGSSDLYLTADNPDKPGSLWSTPIRINNFLDQAHDADRFAIPQFHGGSEYLFTQTATMRGDFVAALDAGAGIIIAHHPHVVHGITQYDAGDGPRYVIGSLGNFVFDQEVWETFSSYVASVDLEQGLDGVEVARIRLIPIHLDDYVPRLLTGVGVAELGRWVAHLGTAEELGGGFDRTVVFAEGGKLAVALSEEDVETTDLIDQRNLPLSNGSTGPVALDPYTDTDALAEISTSTTATCELAVDRMQYGDFEDRDVDDRAGEGDRWNQTSARYVQRHTAHSGMAAAVLLRSSSNISKASIDPIGRLPILPSRKVSVAGWSKGSNAGKFEVQVRWRTSAGSTISTTLITVKTGGTWDWQPFSINVTAPANADSIELDYMESPPDAGEGLVFLDDLTVLEWDPGTLQVNGSGTEIPTPNGWDAVRCAAGGGALDMTLTHRVYESQ